MEVLTRTEWCAREHIHQDRVDAATAGHRLRSADGVKHPVDDFMFTYYRLRPAQLRRWHPGAGVALLDAPERSDWRFHRLLDTPAGPAVMLDVSAYEADRRRTVRFVASLLAATSAAVPQFGCFGLHEWAMVYRQDSPERRHSATLRLGAAATDEVLEKLQLRCSHFDATRFFTPPALVRNQLTPGPDDRTGFEQPGCLHAGMDLYKWAYKFGPLVPGPLLLDCFHLAREIRLLDMQASPYDLAGWGLTPVPVETATGKAQYVAGQREFTRRGQLLRTRLLAHLGRWCTGEQIPPADPAGTR